MPLLERLPARRFELLFCMALLLACCGLIGLARASGDLASLLTLATMEMVLPLAMGLVSAGLIAGDPALEMLLTYHLPVWRILAERVAILFGVSVGFGVLLLALAQKWVIDLPKDGADRIFIWLSPLVFFIGLANAVALLRGRFLDGAIAVAGVMGLSLLALLRIPQLCTGRPQDAQCVWWLANPIMTLGNAGHPTWPLNRLVYLGAGIGLLAFSFSLAEREEPLLPRGLSDE